MRLRGVLVRLATAAAIIAVAAPALAQPADLAVKAAFVPRFARYVTWPPTAMPRGADPFVVCVIGSDPFGGMLEDAARSQTVDGHGIVVRRMDSAADADSCQIAFVGGSRAGQIIAALDRKPILTVTDARSSGARGIIHFVVSGGRVRFFIDQASAVRRGLAISSRLLALAVGVRQ